MSSSCDTSMFFAVHSWSPLQMSFGRQCLHFPQVIFCPPLCSTGLYLSLHSYYDTFSLKSQVFSEKILIKKTLSRLKARAESARASRSYALSSLLNRLSYICLSTSHLASDSARRVSSEGGLLS